MAIGLKPIADQVVVVTGASSGIGLVTARRLARAGADVMLISRNAVALRDIAAGIVADGGSAAFTVADVGDPAQVAAAGNSTIDRFGRIDTWINCAGVAIYAKLIDTPEDEHQRLFRTNYFGVVHGCLTAIEKMRCSGGVLITVGSIAGDIPSPIMGAYDASKHAVKGFIESLRIELFADTIPISLTLIKPAGMNTPIAEHAANHLGAAGLIPPPVYDPSLVADAIMEAAQYPRDTITVGGVGRAQVLLGTHFPTLLARFGGLISPLLSDATRKPDPGSNLDTAATGGHERSKDGHGRRFSVYAVARQARPAPLLVAISVLVVGGLLSRQYRASKRLSALKSGSDHSAGQLFGR